MPGNWWTALSDNNKAAIIGGIAGAVAGAIITLGGAVLRNIIRYRYLKALERIDAAIIQYRKEKGPSSFSPPDDEAVELAGVSKRLGRKALAWRKRNDRYGF